MAPEEQMCIGKIVGVHGMKGAVKLYSYIEALDFFQAGRKVFLVAQSGATREVTIKWAKPHKSRLALVTLEEIANRTQAEGVVGATLSVSENHLPVLEDDSFYWKDLIGLGVYGVDGTYLGILKQILPTGSNDVYIVEHYGREILVPALKSVVVSVDLGRKTMTVALPEGL